MTGCSWATHVWLDFYQAVAPKEVEQIILMAGDKPLKEELKSLKSVCFVHPNLLISTLCVPSVHPKHRAVV